ncbi:MAG: mechanosensitive ion channel, partial [Gemmatimonadetes bacterium]|nr:mechanosensitive ion channel [Gemmatimonadota bacterium]
MNAFFQHLFTRLGAPEITISLLALTSAVLLVAVLSLLAYLLARRAILNPLIRLIRRTTATWDDALLDNRVLHRLTHLAPIFVLYHLAPLALDRYGPLAASAVQIYLTIVTLLVIGAALSAGLEIYGDTGTAEEISIKSVVQFAKVVLYFIGGIFVVSILLGKTPLYLLSGLGALTAVLVLVFKDAILGFVAGIQLTANKMVARGDWIEMPNYGADGDVLDVSLTTVKVQNWDKTVTTIPTYALISNSFKNWRGMQESGGRRIKRSINIDVNTIKFCDEEMLARFARIQHIAAYIEGKKEELAAYNQELRADLSSPANGRRLTNVGTFRAYVVAYLRHHPMVNRDMTFL